MPLLLILVQWFQVNSHWVSRVYQCDASHEFIVVEHFRRLDLGPFLDITSDSQHLHVFMIPGSVPNHTFSINAGSLLNHMVSLPMRFS